MPPAWVQPALAARLSSRVASPDHFLSCGAAPSDQGQYVRRVLARDDLHDVTRKLGKMTAAQRSDLPGVSTDRCHQVFAGALVVEAVMDIVGIGTLVVCPWALREGLILQTLDLIPAP